MKIIKDIYKKTGVLHHAYLLEGEKESIRQNLFTFLEKELQHPIHGNPDFWHQHFETFSIDDARALREIQTVKAFAHSRKIFVIETVFMTVEAQNSLLKIFEEPTADTHFFVIVPSQEILLPTLKSRFFIIQDFDTERSKNTLREAQEFLKMSLKERLEKVSEIIEAKDKIQAIRLIDNLIRILSGSALSGVVLQELLKTRMYLNDRSPSLKLLLEQTALIV